MITYTKFDDLTDSQKQDMAQEFLRDMLVINQNTVVDYILSKSIEGCNEAPFSYDDISNNTPTGQVEINGSWYTLDEDVRDEKLEFYGRLRDKSSGVVDARCDNLNDYRNSEVEPDVLDAKHLKAVELHSRFETTCDELENMDFDDYPEIMQWFECDGYLLRRLEEYGECILGGTYWGRQGCGQSIILDNVMQKIAYDHYTETSYNIVPENLSFLIKSEDV